MEKYLIFFDIDETLYFNKNSSIPESTIEAIYKLKAAGHVLAIATGRPKFQLIDEVHDLPFDIYVLSNGQYVVQNGILIYENAIECDMVKKLIDRANDAGIYLGLVVANSAALTGINDDIRENFEKINSEIPVVDPSLYERESILQMWMFSQEFDRLGDDLDDLIRFVPWIEFGGDLLPSDASKANGIKKLIEANDDALPKKVVFFGDGSNDIESMQLADIGVAMGNAVDSLKKIADFVTKDIDDDGIYYACEKLNLF